jgi:hypothetical protein
LKNLAKEISRYKKNIFENHIHKGEIKSPVYRKNYTTDGRYNTTWIVCNCSALLQFPHVNVPDLYICPYCGIRCMYEGIKYKLGDVQHIANMVEISSTIPYDSFLDKSMLLTWGFLEPVDNRSLILAYLKTVSDAPSQMNT